MHNTKKMRIRGKEWRSRKGRYYRKNLIIVLIVSSIPGFIIGALVYWMAGGRLEAELLAMHNRQIEQRAATIDDQLAGMELMLAHWAFDPKFNYTLDGIDLVREHERSWDITKTLLVMQGSNVTAHRVELYLSGERPVLFSPEYGTLGTAAVTARYEQLLDTEQSTYWTQQSFDPARPDLKLLTLVHHIPGGSRHPFGTLLLQLDPEKIADMLQTMTPYNGGETFMMDEEGGLFVSGGGAVEASPFVAALRKAIGGQDGNGTSSFLFRWEDATYAVTYGDFGRISDEWMYVSASPITGITAPVVSLSSLIFMVSLSALLLAALLSWFASRKIYSPVGRLFQTLLPEQEGGAEDEFALIERHWEQLHGQRHALQHTLSEQMPHVKRSFMQQLFQGYLYAYSEQELRSRMKRYKWELDEECAFMALYIQLTGISSLEGKFRNGDESLVTFAAVNIIGELASQHFTQAEIVNFHDLTAGVLLVEPQGRISAEGVMAFGEELEATIGRMLKMQITVAFGAPVSAVSQIPRVYEKAKQAARHRQFDGGSQLIDIERLDEAELEASQPRFSLALEQGLIQAVRMGEADEANRLLEQFLESLCAGGAKVSEVQQGMLHLLGGMLRTVIVAGIDPGRLYRGENLYASLSRIHEPKLMLVWFREKAIAPFLNELSERSDSGVRRAIEQAMRYIEERYMEDISLESCADHTGTSPFLLSRSFKRVTGINFIDYLTGLRIGKAKELLRDTDMKMNEVAESVGYRQSYFNRIFKKQEGITPTRFRELSRGEGGFGTERGADGPDAGARRAGSGADKGRPLDR